MSANPELSSIRAKKIGLLILDGRKAADKESPQGDIVPMNQGSFPLR
jgi:hypothetical protein